MATGKEESSVIHGEAQKAVTECDAPKKKGRNKFAIACTVLASMNSILLGYGEFRRVFMGWFVFQEKKKMSLYSLHKFFFSVEPNTMIWSLDFVCEKVTLLEYLLVFILFPDGHVCCVKVYPYQKIFPFVLYFITISRVVGNTDDSTSWLFVFSSTRVSVLESFVHYKTLY